MRRPILVGQAPSRTSGASPFAASSGSCARLAQLLGVRHPFHVHDLLDCRNLLAEWPGHTRGNGHGRPDGRRRRGGDHFPWAVARVAAERLWDRVAPFLTHAAQDEVLLLLAGRKVAECFGLRDLEPLVWRSHAWRGRAARVALLPHPSGVSRWYSDPQHILSAAVFLRQATESRSNILQMSRAELERLFPGPRRVRRRAAPAGQALGSTRRRARPARP